MASAPALWPRIGLLALAFGLGLTVAVLMVFGRDWLPPPAITTPAPISSTTGPLTTPFVMPGLERPPTLSVATASVPDDAEVLGVSAGRRHRAYLVSTLSRVTSHVVNDVLDEVPVTVTFCDRSGCARAFTSPDRTDPLKVDLGGIYQDKMLLRWNGLYYDQESGIVNGDLDVPPFPFPECPMVRTTWKKWKESHPDTDIFVGKPPAPPPTETK